MTSVNRATHASWQQVASARIDVDEAAARTAVASIGNPGLNHSALRQFDRTWQGMVAMRACSTGSDSYYRARQIARKDPILKKAFSGETTEQFEKLQRLFSHPPYDATIFYSVGLLLNMNSLESTPEYGAIITTKLLGHLYFNTSITVLRFCRPDIMPSTKQFFIALSRVAERVAILYSRDDLVCCRVFKLEKDFQQICDHTPLLDEHGDAGSYHCARRFLEFVGSIDQEMHCCLEALKKPLCPPLRKLALDYVGIDYIAPALSAVPELEIM